MLSGVDLDAMTQSWHAAIVRPPLAQFRVLVAVADDRVVRFAALGPSDDPDAEPGQDGIVAEFAVDPVAQRSGHSSRLLNACMDTLPTASSGHLVGAFHRRRAAPLLVSSGWAADGGHQEIDATRLKLVRLHTDISA